MENLQTLETQVLIELLVQQTAEYTAKIVQKNSIELMQYEYDISLIQSELNSRQQKADPGIPDTNVEFTTGKN